jgi:hypothetical protein
MGANAAATGNTATANHPVTGMRRLEDNSSMPRELAATPDPSYPVM